MCTRLPTNFDFFVELDNSTQIFFEIKYTEYGFGKAKKDEYHIRKFEHTYDPLLRENRFITDKYKTIDLFLANYQLMRNLIHIKQKKYVVFIYPRSNQTVLFQAEGAFNEILTRRGASRLRCLHLEDLSKDLYENIASGKLRSHYEEFISKYIAYDSL